jgi:biopolymer transport protein ExbB
LKVVKAFIVFMNSGGAINWLIFALYLLDLGIFSWRAVYFFQSRCRRTALMDALREGGFPMLAAKVLPRETYSPLYRAAAVFAAANSAANGGNQDAALPAEAALHEAVDREAALLTSEMEKGAGFLSFAASAAPLMGLLGTITGLMAAFSQIEQRGAAVDISFLSGGIREAMITTATGLVTALFAFAFCKFFEHIAASRLKDVSLAVSFLTEFSRRAA